MMKINLLFTTSFFIFYTFLDATIIEDIFLKSPEGDKEFALYGSYHDEKGEWQFPWICQAILHTKEPLLVLCEDDNSKFLQPSKTSNAAEIEKFILTQALMTDDIILDKIRALHVYNYFPPSVTYRAIDNRIFSPYTTVLRSILEPLVQSMRIWWWRFKMIPRETLLEMATKAIDTWQSNCLINYRLISAKGISFDKKFKDPSLEQLLLSIGLDIQVLKERTVPAQANKFYFWILEEHLEARYGELQKYCRETFTAEELKMTLSNYILTNFMAGNTLKIKKLTHIYDNYYMSYFHRILDIEVLYRVYRTHHKRIALFAGANHVRHLTAYFQTLGWNIVHKTECDYKNGVPPSDFDFLK